MAELETTPDVDALVGSVDDLDDDLIHRMSLHCAERGRTVDERRAFLDMLGLPPFQGRDLRPNVGGQFRYGRAKFKDTGYDGPAPGVSQSAAQ